MNRLRKLYCIVGNYAGYISKIRFLLFSWKFVESGKRCSLGKRVSIRGKTDVILGNRVTIRSDVVFAGGGCIHIDDNTTINEGCIITAVKELRIGKECMLASNVRILDVDHVFDRRDIPISKQGYKVLPVKVCDDVWIGTGVVITKGVTIGKGSVIAANAVVTKNIPPYIICGGVPAKKISDRK